ncbi:pseudouridine synthase C [Seminavis robusta]|uniref:Pseudouridine synthase C n=1 Tax=Seminavis robusta TaxID=568900 RepID=A0A9N8F2U3_9STRA|nr:pseudouridine synthase C [Seminavis robusta]|eukprot:Sro2902_g339830.1 pseudouridine synthase C (433) ;mRNA; f:2011-3309
MSQKLPASAVATGEDQATATTPNRAARLSHIDADLRIRVLYDDEDFVVIDKPCNLRSVPGNAATSTDVKERGQKRTLSGFNKDDDSKIVKGQEKSSTQREEKSRLTAQEAWQAAIESCSTISNTNQTAPDGGNILSDDAIFSLKQIAVSDSTIRASIPRKCKVFLRYINRNQKRFLQLRVASDSSHLEELASEMYKELKRRQTIQINLPEPTNNEESAFGQLVIMGYDGTENKTRESNKLFVVHRLDCETSGVMVFARNRSAASSLSQAWREREEQVSKEYLAKVRYWPPYHEQSLMHGKLEVPLEPSKERLKWKVAKHGGGGKPSTTIWKVITHQEKQAMSGKDKPATSSESEPILLSLTPVTGRTHQLRIHCAHVGTGIIGDSLYGDDRASANIEGDDDRQVRLMLHALRLAFPHPSTGKRCEFTSSPRW